MRLDLNHSDASRVLGLCVLGASMGFATLTAHAQSVGTPATSASGPKEQKPSSTAKIKDPVIAVGCKSALLPGKPFFIEFRSRGAASYGHTFVFHGRLGGGNKFAEFKVAGLHPKGDDASTYLMGHVVPVPAETGVSYGDLDEQYLTARFCVTLNEAEYRKAAAYIRQLQATTKTWHASGYNCNSFASDIAKSIGLDSPNPNLYVPERFINRLRDLNPVKKNAELAPTSDKTAGAS